MPLLAVTFWLTWKYGERIYIIYFYNNFVMDDYFVSHIKDLKRECIEKDYLTYSSFLGLLEQAKLKREMPYLITDKVRYYAEENAERKILVFLPSYYSSLEEAMEEIKLISLLLISPKSEKFSEAISHRH